MHDKVLKLGLAVFAIVVFGRATCGPAPGSHVTPVEKLSFTDHVYYHNMGIAWDGEYYYTVNGGNTSYSELNEYDGSGSFEDGYDVGTDARSILHSTAQEQLYVKPYGTSLDEVDLDLEETDVDLENTFTGEQSSVAMSPDGEKLYELYGGRVHVYDAVDGKEETSFQLSSYSTEDGKGYSFAIAASDKFLFVWAPNSDQDVLVYGLDGKYVTKFTLPRSGFGFSLSWANGMLWIADDADGGSEGADGTWYGFTLEGL
jgi:hypothetical protein